MTEPSIDVGSDLRVELRFAVGRPLPRVFEDGLRGDVADFPTLTEIVGSLREGLPLNNALRDVINAALPLLSDKDFPSGKTGQWQSKLSWLAVGRILTGFADDLPRPNGKERHSYDDLCAIVRERAELPLQKVSESSFRRHVTGAFKDLLADILINRQEALAASLRSPGAENMSTLAGAKATSGYVERPQLHQEYFSALQAGAKVIVFVGQAGMGKTSLARELLRTPDGELGPEVGFLAGSLSLPDIYGVAASSNLGLPSAADPTGCLATLCCGHNARPILLLDNFDTTDDLMRILPSAATSTIVATCRAVGKARTRDFHVIKVGPMSVREAAELIRLYLPQILDQDASRLADTLGRCPLAIEKSCAVIRKTGLSVDEFLNELAFDHGEAFGQMPSMDGTSFSTILQRLVGPLEQDDPLALKILLLTVYSQKYVGYTPKDFVRDYLTSDCRGRLSGLRFEGALQGLEDLALIDVMEETLWREHYGTFERLTIHPLVQNVLYNLFPGREGDFAIGLYEQLYQCRVSEPIDLPRIQQWNRYTAPWLFYSILGALIGAHDGYVQQVDLVNSSGQHMQFWTKELADSFGGLVDELEYWAPGMIALLRAYQDRLGVVHERSVRDSWIDLSNARYNNLPSFT